MTYCVRCEWCGKSVDTHSDEWEEDGRPKFRYGTENPDGGDHIGKENVGKTLQKERGSMRKFNFEMNRLDELTFALEHPRVRNWTLARVRQEGEIAFIEYNRWTGQYRYWGSEGAYHSPWMAQTEIRQKLDWDGLK